jgi:hypothetical protein
MLYYTYSTNILNMFCSFDTPWIDGIKERER